MSVTKTETLQRLLARFIEQTLADLPREQREDAEVQLRKRADDLLRNAAKDGGSFQDLVGLGAKQAGFGDLPMPAITSDFDEAVIPTQLHAAAELYLIYQYERMKVFDVVGVLLRLFHDGRIRVQRGPGARALYVIEKHHPLRYKKRDRMLAYRRAFNYGALAPTAGAKVYTGFHRQFIAFASAIAQYYRDLLIGEVIRGAQTLEQRPFGSQATIQRLGADLRWELDRCTYGNIYSLTVETGDYLRTVLDALETPDVKKAFDANNKWDVIEAVSQRYLGGAAALTQRAKMAEAGRQMLRFAATNDMKQQDFNLFQTIIRPIGPVAEEWIAAYRMTPEGQRFPGVTGALTAMLGTTRGVPPRVTAA